MDDRVAKQLDFLMTVDRLKAVARRNLIFDGSRRENSAEHSWHVALAAVVLREHFLEPVDLVAALEMALVHDLVETFAGDTFAYGATPKEEKDRLEREAADRVFAALPQEQGRRLRTLWDQFERSDSPEARFVRAMDRLQPLLLHRLTGGRVWKEHGVRRSQVLERVGDIRRDAPALWPFVQQLLDEAVRAGQLGAG